MKKRTLKIRYNSPVILNFALISLIALLLDYYTDGWTNMYIFSVYRSSFADLLTYPRFFLHVLGHADVTHFMSNIMMLLVVGPPLEEKYGSKNVLSMIVITAFISGLVEFVFFPGTALLGASGIVFMMIVLLSMTGMKEGGIPLTLILVLFVYLGKEIISGILVEDNVSQLTHIIGGLVGAVCGFVLNAKKQKKKL